MKPALFCCSDSASFPGYCSGAHWNGWSVPLFEADVCHGIAKDPFFRLGDGSPIFVWDAPSKSWLQRSDDYPEEPPVVIAPRSLTLPSGETKVVWGMGDSFVWSEDKPPASP